MSSRKRFTINKELATGIRNTVQVIPHSAGQLHYDLMLLDVIERDPNNPRKLNISQQELLNGIDKNESNFQSKQNELEELRELAESIKKIGVRNAIEVYKSGSKYRIISGERRFLASLLIGQKHIPARINEKPDDFKLRYMQWVENINRKDLSLFEKYNNLMAISDAYKRIHNKEIDIKALQEVLGTEKTQTYRYFSLLSAKMEIIKLISESKLTNLKIVDELSRLKDKKLQDDILHKIKDAKTEITSLNNFTEILNEHNSSRRSAIGSYSVSLGKIKNKEIARELFQILMQDKRLAKYQENFTNIDWLSEKKANQAFKELIKLLGKEIISI